MKKESIGIALLGFGNVGSGTYRVLEENAALISKRVGADVCVRAILVRDLNIRARAPCSPTGGRT